MDKKIFNKIKHINFDRFIFSYLNNYIELKSSFLPKTISNPNDTFKLLPIYFPTIAFLKPRQDSSITFYKDEFIYNPLHHKSYILTKYLPH